MYSYACVFVLICVCFQFHFRFSYLQNSIFFPLTAITKTNKNKSSTTTTTTIHTTWRVQPLPLQMHLIVWLYCLFCFCCCRVLFYNALPYYYDLSYSHYATNNRTDNATTTRISNIVAAGSNNFCYCCVFLFLCLFFFLRHTSTPVNRNYVTKMGCNLFRQKYQFTGVWDTEETRNNHRLRVRPC